MGTYSFPKEERLRKKEDFERILKEGKVYYCPPIIVYINKKGERRRLGISVNKKVGSAVIRNRIKRLIREVYRLNRPYILDNVEILVIVKPNGKKIKNFAEMEKILKNIWKSANIFKDVKEDSCNINKNL